MGPYPISQAEVGPRGTVSHSLLWVRSLQLLPVQARSEGRACVKRRAHLTPTEFRTFPEKKVGRESFCQQKQVNVECLSDLVTGLMLAPGS